MIESAKNGPYYWCRLQKIPQPLGKSNRGTKKHYKANIQNTEERSTYSSHDVVLVSEELCLSAAYIHLLYPPTSVTSRASGPQKCCCLCRPGLSHATSVSRPNLYHYKNDFSSTTIVKQLYTSERSETLGHPICE